MFNKGAMFGLDARIALAIFGALSVISGAALYSAIQEGKAVSVLAEMTEVSKSVESYLLDTGTDIPLFHDQASLSLAGIFLEGLELIDSSQAGWKGPYLPFTDAADDIFINNGDKVYYLMRAANTDFGGEDGPSQTQPTVCGSPCYYWIGLRGIDVPTVKAIDIKVDGGSANTYDSGNIRLFPNGAEYNIWLRGPLAL